MKDRAHAAPCDDITDLEGTLRFADHGALPMMVAIAPLLRDESAQRGKAIEALEPDWRKSWDAHKPYYDAIRDLLEKGRPRSRAVGHPLRRCL